MNAQNSPNTCIIRSVSRTFIYRERELLFTNTANYADEILQYVQTKHIARMFGTCISTVERSRGASVLIGLLAITTMLKHWQEYRNHNVWFESQLIAIENLGIDSLQEYVTTFLSDPSLGIPQVMRSLDVNLPIYDFISFCEQRYPKSSIGAFFMIGLLLFVDNNQFDENIIVLQE